MVDNKGVTTVVSKSITLEAEQRLSFMQQYKALGRGVMACVYTIYDVYFVL